MLSRDHPLTSLIVLDAHARVRHNGVKETLTEVRSKFLVIKDRSLVRRLIHCCILCKRFEGAPFATPPPPPLPTYRVKDDPAFTHTDVDFAGPLFVRASSLSKTVKVWICLYMFSHMSSTSGHCCRYVY